MTSTIKVNKHQNACGTNIIQRCGTTTTIGSGASNTLVMDGSAVTIGRCGGTVALASGATQTGFGRTGTVDWQTGDIKTSTFTAVNGQGFFVDTNGGTVTANLPAGSAGAIVSFQDYRNTFDTNSFTVTPNGSEKINGGEGPVVLSTEGEGITLVYIDSTVGWRSIQDNVFADTGSNFILASGGTETTSGNCKIHTFTGPGTFTVSALAACAAQNIVSYMVVGAGGSSHPSSPAPGGAGAGGFREVKNPVTPYTASPLDGYPTPGNRITITTQAYPITVGAGAGPNAAGNPSIFSTITSAAGGGGGGAPYAPGPTTSGGPGGSGGGGGGGPSGTGGTGNTPPVTPAQGQNGGNGDPSPPNSSGGGGGAGAVGGSGTSARSGGGGAGVTTEITASPVVYAAGGAGKGLGPTADGNAATCGAGADTAGTANRGNGGGGGCNGTGGSGIVVIRYKFQ
jgi:hypothetical protein